MDNDLDFLDKSNIEDDEQEWDSIIDSIGEEIEIEDSKTSILNFDKVKQVMCVYKAAKYLARKTKAKVTYQLNEPFRSMGSVSIVGKNISFTMPALFHKAASFASSVDIYPKSDGSVQIDFTFHGLTTVIE